MRLGRAVQTKGFGSALVSARKRSIASAAELLALAPDVILANDSPELRAVLQATHDLPILFANVPDPVGQGFFVARRRCCILCYGGGKKKSQSKILQADLRTEAGAPVQGLVIRAANSVSVQAQPLVHRGSL